MDFTQKIIDKQREVQELCANEAARKAAEKESEDERLSEMEIPPPQDPSEEWSVLTLWGYNLVSCDFSGFLLLHHLAFFF